MRDHLRVCGADSREDMSRAADTGSPPRVRSRLPVLRDETLPLGITSACAEQTERRNRKRTRPRDHLRVCGADEIVGAVGSRVCGSPPRVRSRRTRQLGGVLYLGITSACAEQTGSSRRWNSGSEDHLRVCGADSLPVLPRCHTTGSPPRVRSRPERGRRRQRRHGITSACAEQTRRVRR